MPDFQQFTAPVVLHHALIDAVPKTTNGNMDFNFAQLKIFYYIF